jgi:prephenate dehydratase
VAHRDIDEGLVPVENSLGGEVNETLDALLQFDGLYMRRELVLPVEHCLIAAPGTEAFEIETITSHPQALAQCRGYLERNFPGARLEAALSTAGAVEQAVATKGAAAIGTRRAAELTGGRIIAAGIQDVALNKTRFVILADSDASPSGDDKTSIAFTVTHDRPGTLLGVLSELANRQINMTRIESRPSRQDLGIYIFLIDFQGHRQEPLVQDALRAVEANSHYFRMFGSYPRFVEGA